MDESITVTFTALDYLEGEAAALERRIDGYSSQLEEHQSKVDRITDCITREKAVLASINDARDRLAASYDSSYESSQKNKES